MIISEALRARLSTINLNVDVKRTLLFFKFIHAILRGLHC